MNEKQSKPNELINRELKPFVEPTPFGFMRRFTTDMDRIFQDFGGFNFPNFFTREFYPRQLETEPWSPALEIRRKDGQFTVHMELPGVKKEDVKVEVTNNFLTLSGERKQELEQKREGFFRTERSYGAFYRAVPLPEGARTDTATARIADGVLEVTMEAPQIEKVRNVEIKGREENVKAKTATG